MKEIAWEHCAIHSALALTPLIIFKLNWENSRSIRVPKRICGLANRRVSFYMTKGRLGEAGRHTNNKFETRSTMYQDLHLRSLRRFGIPLLRRWAQGRSILLGRFLDWGLGRCLGLVGCFGTAWMLEQYCSLVV